MSDDKNNTPNESPTSSKGKKFIDVKFVDDSNTVPIVKEQICTNNTNKNERKEEKKDGKAAGVKQNKKTGSNKRVSANEPKDIKRNTDEPKVKRSKGVVNCENLLRRTSPRKCSGRDSSLDKEEVIKRKSVTAKVVSNGKRTSTLTQRIGKANNVEMKNTLDTKNSPASNRKRKREEETKQNGFSSTTLQSTDGKLNDSNKSPAKLSKIQGNSGVKQKLIEKNQQTKKHVDKRPVPNNHKDDNSFKVEKENNELNDEGWESDSCSDDELMETALSPSSKNFKFELNDVVWAKLYRDPFWPAQVGFCRCSF